MKTPASLLCALAMNGSLLPLPGAAETPSNPADSWNQFSVAMIREVARGGGDFFFSPFSIHSALSLAAAGAQGATQTELNRVLGFTGVPGLAASGAAGRQIVESAESAGMTFRTSNALWRQQGLPLLPAYVALVRDHFAASLEECDFATATEPARTRINAAISKDTNGKIPELLQQGDLRNDTRLVLTNAVYFLADWETMFPTGGTTDADFHQADGAIKRVPFMARTGRMGYAATPEGAWLELPYKGGAFSALFFLPGDGKPLDGVLNSFAPAMIPRVFPYREVSVRLPKFERRQRMELRKILTALGMGGAFTDGADFSGITGGKDLAIDAVVHEAFVRVDEKGTEAAAATGLVMRTTSINPNPPVEFHADRPFFFLIRERTSGAILFAGRIAGF